MSLWKYSFELVTKELEVTKKKKQALENLYGSEKISQSTYEHLDAELSKAITELEEHLKSLMNKMSGRTQELEEQISTLELFLASLEIHYAAGDVGDETYVKQNNAILLGLDATKKELNDIISSYEKPKETVQIESSIPSSETDYSKLQEPIVEPVSILKDDIPVEEPSTEKSIEPAQSPESTEKPDIIEEEVPTSITPQSSDENSDPLSYNEQLSL